MNLAYKKILGKFTKVLGFGKTPPPCWEKFPNDIVFFLRAYLRYFWVFIPSIRNMFDNIARCIQFLAGQVKTKSARADKKISTKQTS